MTEKYDRYFYGCLRRTKIPFGPRILSQYYFWVTLSLFFLLSSIRRVIQQSRGYPFCSKIRPLRGFHWSWRAIERKKRKREKIFLPMAHLFRGFNKTRYLLNIQNEGNTLAGGSWFTQATVAFEIPLRRDIAPLSEWINFRENLPNQLIGKRSPVNYPEFWTSVRRANARYAINGLVSHCYRETRYSAAR